MSELYYDKNDPLYLEVIESIKNLYKTFSSYPKPSKLTCFDSLIGEEGCNSITKDILSYNLQDIPFLLIDDLEFYGEGEECATTEK